MKTIEMSIRQMLRTPIRSGLFLLLLVLASSLLAMGAGLYLLSMENAKRLEDVFMTIGTVEQKPIATHEREFWDAEKKKYVPRGQAPEYGPIVPVEALYFEGASYVRPPVRRPYYGAYNPDWIAHKLDWSVTLIAQTRESLPVLELQPVEDCVPDHPVTMKIKKVLYGTKKDLDGWETLLFCDHYNPNPQPLYASKTYVMALAYKVGHSDFPKFTMEYFPGSFYYNQRENRSDPIDRVLPVTSTQYRPDGTRMPDLYPMDAPWEEVTEGFYDTPRGRRWLEYAEAMYIAEKTIPVMPIENTELLMSFYLGNSNIVEGRDITAQEYRQGERVCLINQEFARLNGFSLGDRIVLPLYYADYRDSAGKDFSPGDMLLGVFDHLLNAQGKRYEIFEKNEYAVVGIYNEINKVVRSTGYDMAASAVVIPAASVKNSDAQNILDYGPMMGYNTVFQIPNGTIEQYQKAWEKQGIDNLTVTFYDRGYTQVKAGLENIRKIALALFIAGILIALLILLFFCQVFIGKQKKRTAIERSLGMTKAACTLSLLSGILAIALLGSVVGSAAGYFLTGSAMSLLGGDMRKEAFSTDYSNWVDSADADMDISIDVSSKEPAVYVLSGAFIVLLAAGISLAGIRGNLKSEPLKLLSARET